ncbi:hypothetical protein BTO06_12360 [Tenacibaculum sp. SZ-18]|uniref:DUF6119 family protein n=1 Tax=Tenacibaculum sp. SZ-18 TaxID=754423 RepID=UPI000C2D3F9B|nr:DUF6119 family protein [Tenacibaculum sp. SZ-18]AUC15895.1 hypothetical protein BTO06_12360 [Tenacibaculum sp. SZ-18]
MTQNPKIYRINTKDRLLTKLPTCELIIEKIINTSFAKLGIKETFSSTSLKKISKDEITYYLYLYDSNETVSDWKDFLPKELTQNEGFIQQKLSLVLFAETEFDIFCIIGGNAFQIILPFIDKSFGLNVYSRIMQPQYDQIASIKSRGITGSRAGLSEQFRDNYRIIDYIKFGKVTKEIHLKLSQETTDLHFGFLKNKENDKIQIYVSKAFKIKKNLDFNELHKVIEELVVISELAPSDYLDSYKEITDTNLKDNILHQELITHLFNDTENLGRRKSNEHKSFQHDFCNPNNIEKFYEADEFRLKEKTENNGYTVFKIVYDRNEIYDAVLNRAVERFGVNDRFNFMNFVRSAYVTCYQDGNHSIGSGFIFHISTEFPYDGTPIFLVDTKWYRLQDSFVEDLKTNTKHVLKTYKASNKILTEPWDKNVIRVEGDYNFRYNSKPNYIVIDTIIADGLELCDIIHYDDNNIYLIHVKYGFQSKIRELTNQITISARRLRETLGTKNKPLLEKIYNRLIKKNIILTTYH